MPEPPATAVLPSNLRPMLAESAERPFTGAQYGFEVKWDGMRVLIGVDGERMSIRTRNNVEAVSRFPELAVLREALAAERVILDGEIVRLVEGVPSFWALLHRIQASRPADIEKMAREEPAALILFDVLQVRDEWVMDRPWSERRGRLEELVTGGPVIQLSPVWDDGMVLWQAVSQLQLEGMMAKRRTGKYTPGKRSPAWLKIKATQTMEAVVGGWTEGSGGRHDTLGALVLGEWDGDELRYIGRVGSGFDFAGLDEALAALAPLEVPECPFTPKPPKPDTRPHWVRPERPCEVRFQGWSDDHHIRFPVFLRWV